MATYGGFNFTGFKGVNLRNSAAIRIEGDGGKVGTLSIASSQDGDRAWRFPDKSGTFGISGTFAVQMPAVTSWGETMVTISGLRREDAFTCQIRDMGGTVTTTRTFPIIAGARPENGYVYLTFYNPTVTATIYSELVLSYVVSR